MNKTIVVCAVAGTLLMVSGCDKGEFREISSTEGRFKVQMPGSPTEKTDYAVGVAMKTWMLEFADGGYAVAYADMPIPAGESDYLTQKRLEGARDGMVRNINGKLTRSSQTALQGKYPGRDVEAELPGDKGILRASIYLVGQRIYMMMVLGKRAWVNSADASKFLDSLVVTEK